MKRYNGEGGREEGFFPEDDENMEGQPQEVDAIIDVQDGLLGAMELDIAELGLNQELLHTAIELAKQDMWWCFRSQARKVRRVERIYRRLTRLVRETLENQEEEKV